MLATRKPDTTDSLIRTSLTALQVRSDLIRSETLEGRKYTVAPVIPLVEGVVNGEFVSFEEMAVFPDSWDGIPLPIDHPKNSDGDPITANSPEVIEKSVVGRLFNVVAREDIRGISGEIWIDNEKAATVPGGAESLRRIMAGEPLEVSTAYNTFVDGIRGEFKNKYGEIERFRGTQTQLRPDHLALLPDAIGACNWRDGCGAPRINSAGTCKEHGGHAVDSDISGETPLKDTAKQNIKTNGKQLGLALTAAITANEGTDNAAGMKSRLASAAGITNAKLSEIIDGTVDFIPRKWINIFAAVLDVDPYELYMACSNDSSNLRYSGNEGEEKVKSEEVITPKPEEKNNSTEDVKDVSMPDTVEDTPEEKPCGPCAKTANRLQELVINTLKTFGIVKKEESSELEKQQMATKQIVDGVIASNKNKLSESHREWLMTLNDDQIALFDVTEEKKEEVPAKAENAEVKVEVKPEITADVMYKLLGIDPSDIALLKSNAAAVKANRSAKIDKIAATEGCPYAKSELEALSDDSLDKTLELLQPEAPFRIASAVRKSNEKAIAPPQAPSILLATTEAK